MTNPPEGRKARKGHASKDDFAAVIGVTRSRVYAWTREDNPGYPEEPQRRRLAELSRGRYQPEDFARPRSASQPARLEEVSAQVIALAKETRRLADRVEALERRSRPSVARARKEERQ